MADYGRAEYTQTTEEAGDEGNNGENERCVTLSVHRSLQSEKDASNF